MRIINLRLENFQDIRKMDFDLNGQNADIYGANATGKTTIANAFTWLVFGKPSEDIAGYTPKTITADGEAHNLEHSVECEIEIDGEVVTFKRVYHEKWEKKRGNAQAEHTGHTTDYYINGAKKKEKEYARYWEDIFANPELPKLLSMPFYFAETLHWEKRREILLDICGDISAKSVMERDPELSEWEYGGGKQTVEEYKKSLKAALTDINRKIGLFPARIDEANKAIPNTEGYTASGIDAKLATVRANIEQAVQDRADLLSGGDTSAQTRAQIAELNTALADKRATYAERQNAAAADGYTQIHDTRTKLSEAEFGLATLRRDLCETKAHHTSLEKKRADILTDHGKAKEEHEKTQSEAFDEGATICDKCGQPLPADKVGELREAFNLRKSNRLSELAEQMNAAIERGKREASKDMLAAAVQKIEDTEKAIADATTDVEQLKQKLDNSDATLKQAALPPFEQTTEYADLIAEIERIKQTAQSSAPNTSAVDERIEGYRREQDNLNAAKAALDTEATQRARIKELEAEEKALGADYEQKQRELYLCEKFARVKASLLSDKINEKFSTVRFKLFKQNVNGGVEDDCEVLIPSKNGALIPFGGGNNGAKANNAARVNAGIEIVGVLGNHYGVELPIFVDNAESVTDIVPTNLQLIRLVVSKEDRQLRFERL